ncbi:zinc finger protein 485-like isoform X2 [Pleurodeles waltl]|uniref:zinc finger protein 485-like isoform X2 n=1 Tax=Pleurodeles waltl TaxID=8319 RepID=UPI0037099F24
MRTGSAAQQAPDESMLTFCDVAACFSEEEWTLLQNWQKELYRSVMMEIRQAFSSLGPLIAASVFSLRPKEKESVSFQFLQDSEERRRGRAPSVGPCAPGGGLRTDGDSEFGLLDPHDAGTDDGSAGSWFGPEVNPPAASLGIDEEGEMYTIDIQGDPRTGGFNHPAGEASMGTRSEVDSSSICNDKMTLHESAAEQLKVNVNMVSVSETKNLIRKMWSGSNKEGKEFKTEEGDHGRNQQMYSSFYQVMPNTKRSEAYTAHEITTSNNNPNSYTYPEREQKNQKSRCIGHQRAHKGKERHACTECGKSLRSASALLRHERVHTGERPFLCNICGKSYNQKEVLRRHQKMHTGEKPYQCGECGKRFALKHNLVGHQTTHMRRQRSYETGL